MLTPQDLIRPEIRALSAYHVPDARGLIKLDAMENPYGWPEEMTAAWLDGIRHAPLNRYPDPGAAELKARLRQVMGIPAEAGLILGNGSDELIQLVILAVAQPGRIILAPEPSFVMYRMISIFAGMEFVGVPLREGDFGLDTTAMKAALDRYRPAVTFLAYPNNPTGNRFAPEDVREIIASAPGLVVVDEAYFPFTDHSFLAEVSAHGNLLVMRTVSKLGLAGLRLGLLVGADDWINEFEKLRLPYNINVLTQLSAEFALSHWSVLEEQARRIRADRDVLLNDLNDMNGITAYPSEANFILFRTPAGAAERLHAALRDAGVLVKHLSGGVLRDCLRVTVGAASENRAFVSALAAAL